MSEPIFVIELPHVDVRVSPSWEPPQGGPTIEDICASLDTIVHVDDATRWVEEEGVFRLSVTRGSHVEYVRNAAYTALATMFPQRVALLHPPRPS